MHGAPEQDTVIPVFIGEGLNATYALLLRDIAEELHQQLLNTPICATVTMLGMLAVITMSLAMVLNHRFLALTM